MKLRDTLERLVRTFLAAFLASLVGSTVWDYSTARAAVQAGAVALANALLLLVSAGVPALPNPGEGLPGLPVKADG